MPEKLTAPCSNCNGHGKTADYFSQRFDPCLACNGTGRVNTPAGRELLEFLNIHRKAVKDILDGTVRGHIADPG